MNIMKKLILASLFFFAAISGQSEACTASAVPVSPASSNRTPVSGSGQVNFAITVSLDCTAGETYSIAATASNYSAQIGTTSFYVNGYFYRDAGLTQPVFNNPLTGTAATTGTQNITVYGALNVGTPFQGFGSYNLQMTLNATSSGGGLVVLTYTEAGVVQGTCSAGNATANFGSIQTNTKPILPVTVILTCTAGIPYSISQPTVPTVTIGSNTSNTGWLYANSNGTSPLNSNPMLGTGQNSQNVNLFVGLSGVGINDPINGFGAITGSIQYVVTY